MQLPLEESGECRACILTSSFHCLGAAAPRRAAFFNHRGGMKRDEATVWHHSVFPSSTASAESLLFTSRYAVIRLRSRECVPSLPPLPLRRPLRSGTASVARLPPTINCTALVLHSLRSCPAVCTPPSLIRRSSAPSRCSQSTLPLVCFLCVRRKTMVQSPSRPPRVLRRRLQLTPLTSD